MFNHNYGPMVYNINLGHGWTLTHSSHSVISKYSYIRVIIGVSGFKTSRALNNDIQMKTTNEHIQLHYKGHHEKLMRLIL